MLGIVLCGGLSFASHRIRCKARSKATLVAPGIWRELTTVGVRCGAVLATGKSMADEAGAGDPKLNASCDAGSDTLTFTSMSSLKEFIGDKENHSSTEKMRRLEKAAVQCAHDHPVILQYGKGSTRAKFQFSYVIYNAYGNIAI